MRGRLWRECANLLSYTPLRILHRVMDKDRIIKRAVQEQRRGNVGRAIRLRLLASEVKTVREAKQPHPLGPH